MTSDSRARMVALTECFPSLRGVLEVWDAARLEQWACRTPSSGALHAARFVLGVWNDGGEWKCGRFDFHAAYNTWDRDHRAAFLAWAREPWWP